MILKSKTRNEKILDNIFDCFIILVNFTWRTFASLIMWVLAMGFAQQHSGEPHQWFLHLTAFMLFFCPWGSPVKRRLREEYEGYISRSRARKMENEGALFWVEFTFKIERRSLFIDLILLLANIYINGILGVIYGWKTPIIMIYNFIWSIREIIRLLKTN